MDEVIGSSYTGLGNWEVAVIHCMRCRVECRNNPLMWSLVVLLPKTGKGSANLYPL